VDVSPQFVCRDRRMQDLLPMCDARVQRLWPGRATARARQLVATEGAAGGRWWGETEGRWRAAELPGAPVDSYGCGDSFTAGFTFGLASGAPVEQAAELGAGRGAHCLTLVGAP